MGEDDFGNTPTAKQLTEWATDYGLNHPVVADADFGVLKRFILPGANGAIEIGLPSFTLLAPGAEVRVANGYVSEAEIEAVLPY